MASNQIHPFCSFLDSQYKELVDATQSGTSVRTFRRMQNALSGFLTSITENYNKFSSDAVRKNLDDLTATVKTLHGRFSATTLCSQAKPKSDEMVKLNVAIQLIKANILNSNLKGASSVTFPPANMGFSALSTLATAASASVPQTNMWASSSSSSSMTSTAAAPVAKMEFSATPTSDFTAPASFKRIPSVVTSLSQLSDIAKMEDVSVSTSRGMGFRAFKPVQPQPQPMMTNAGATGASVTVAPKPTQQTVVSTTTQSTQQIVAVTTTTTTTTTVATKAIPPQVFNPQQAPATVSTNIYPTTSTNLTTQPVVKEKNEKESAAVIKELTIKVPILDEPSEELFAVFEKENSSKTNTLQEYLEALDSHNEVIQKYKPYLVRNIRNGMSCYDWIVDVIEQGKFIEIHLDEVYEDKEKSLKKCSLNSEKYLRVESIFHTIISGLLKSQLLLSEVVEYGIKNDLTLTIKDRTALISYFTNNRL